MNKKVYKLFVIMFFLSLINAIILTTFDKTRDFKGKRYEGFNLKNFFENFYFALVSILTVSYGDIYPQSDRARAYTAAMLLTSRITLVVADGNI